jgi:hypothetical protein
MSTTTTTTKRSGNKWTINELLNLQREYELLEWSVYQIAEKHQRTVMAILCRLKSEGFITRFREARGFDIEVYKNTISSDNKSEDDDDSSEYVDDQSDEDDDDENDYEKEDEVDQLTDRVWSLQTSVNEISSIVKNIFGLLSNKQSTVESSTSSSF